MRKVARPYRSNSTGAAKPSTTQLIPQEISNYKGPIVPCPLFQNSLTLLQVLNSKVTEAQHSLDKMKHKVKDLKEAYEDNKDYKDKVKKYAKKIKKYKGIVSNHPIFAIFPKFRLRLVSSTPLIHHIEGVSSTASRLKFEKNHQKWELETIPETKKV